MAEPQGRRRPARPDLAPPSVDGMAGQEGRQMRLDADRAHAGAAAAMRNAEGLVQVEVADVGAESPGPRKADLRVQVGAVHVDLAAMRVNDRRRFP